MRLEDVHQVPAVLRESADAPRREAAVHVAAERLHVALVERRPELRAAAEMPAEWVQGMSLWRQVICTWVFYSEFVVKSCILLTLPMCSAIRICQNHEQRNDQVAHLNAVTA